MKLLCELTDDIKITEDIIDLGEGKSRKDMYIEGITLQGEVKNKNNRVYPKAVLSEAIKKHIDEFMKVGRAVGELNHPVEKSSEINPDRISHRFVEVKEDGNNFITKAMVLNTTHGTQVKNLISGGVKMGISSRGFGDVKESGNAKVVQSLYLVSLGDIVTNPSAPNAFVTAVMEKTEWIWENGILVGKDLSEELDEYRDALDKSTQKDRDDVAIDLFKQYLSTISENYQNVDESMKTDIESLKPDKIERKGKAIKITWNSEKDPKKLKAELEKALSSSKDKIKWMGASNENGKAVAEIDLK
jgi:hypothetical protein